MSTKGIVNYQSVQQFEEAMWLSFKTAQEETPNDPVLQAISNKRDAAATLRNAYHHACKEMAGKEGGEESDAAQTPAIVGLKRTAIQAQQEMDSAVRKWYSAQWLGKQAARRGR